MNASDVAVAELVLERNELRAELERIRYKAGSTMTVECIDCGTDFPTHVIAPAKMCNRCQRHADLISARSRIRDLESLVAYMMERINERRRSRS